MKKILLFVLVSVVLGGCAQPVEEPAEALKDFEVTPSQFAEIAAKEETKIVDCRTPEEYETGYIAGAELLPHDKITEESAAELGLSKDDEILVYCKAGARGEKAYNTLTSLGYTNVKNLVGGITRWSEEGKPTVK